MGLGAETGRILIVIAWEGAVNSLALDDSIHVFRLCKFPRCCLDCEGQLCVYSLGGWVGDTNGYISSNYLGIDGHSSDLLTIRLTLNHKRIFLTEKQHIAPDTKWEHNHYK